MLCIHATKVIYECCQLVVRVYSISLVIMNNIPSQGFRYQSVKLWNSKETGVDMRKATQELRTFPI
jgi:hypothetical protein